LRERGRLSIEEIRSILDLTVTEYPDPRELAGTLLATLAGLRRSELRALRWRDVDVENHQIVVSEGYTDGDGFHAAKADSGGRVEVPAVLLEKLAEYKQWTPFDDDEHLLLFGASEGGRIRSVSNWRRNSATGHTPMAARAVTRGFNRVLEAIGISDEERRRRNLVLHSGRHTFASLATERLSVFAAQRLTRHSDIRVLQGYAHPEASETKRFGTDLDDELAQRRKDGSQ
jgi:integrase